MFSYWKDKRTNLVHMSLRGSWTGHSNYEEISVDEYERLKQHTSAPTAEANARPTSIRADQLAQEWELWQGRDCNIYLNGEQITSIYSIDNHYSVWVRGAKHDLMKPMHDATLFTIEWLTAATSASAESAGEGEKEFRLDDNGGTLDKVSTDLIRLHMAISEALGLAFEPHEDIERYTDAIESLQAQLAQARGEAERLTKYLSIATHSLEVIDPYATSAAKDNTLNEDRLRNELDITSACAKDALDHIATLKARQALQADGAGEGGE